MLELWSSLDLYKILTDDRLAAPTSFWRDQFFTTKYYSPKEEIAFTELKTSRRVAPFVLPTEQGKPIYKREGEAVKAFRPAYIKLEDGVRPTEVSGLRPSDLMRTTPLSYAERFDAETVNVQSYHRNAIIRQWDLMAARAIQDGKITIRYRRDDERYNGPPEVTIDFGRDPGHTVVLGPGATWDDPDHDIFSDVQSWMDTMRLAKFGGAASTLIIGAEVVPSFRKNKGIKAMMDTTFRGTEDVSIRQGLLRTTTPYNRLGSLGAGLEVYSYSDQLQNDDDTMFEIMDPKSVVMVAPGVEGIEAFGAIWDKRAGMKPVDIFPRMIDTEDSEAVFIRTQSSPLMIPVYPNRTFKARVLL